MAKLATLASQLSRRIQYTFSDVSLLETALTHCSIKSMKNNNERLEFLGDAILSVIISTALFAQFPNATEGELTRLRASLVCEKTLADIADDLQLGNYLYLGQGERKSGGKYRRSILADAVEAIIGAMYLDGGLKPCQRHVLNWFSQKLANSQLHMPSLKDPKSRLQEYAQSKRYALPAYRIDKVKGNPHNCTFTVHCHLKNGNLSATGVGTSRRQAEQAAAEILLTQLSEDKV